MKIEIKSRCRIVVGDAVVWTTETEAVQVYEDCDGTPLYRLAADGDGVSDDSLREPTTAKGQ